MVRRLLWLNGVAAVLAVSHHAVSWTVTAMFWWAYRYGGSPEAAAGSAQFYGLRLIDLLSQTPVPCFLFVSGYFAAATAGQSGRMTWTIPLRRVSTLLPPFLVWSVVAIAMRLLRGDEPLSAGGAAWLVVSGGAAAAYYYVPLLAVLYLLSPLLVPAARRHWAIVVTPAALLLVAVALLRSAAIVKADLPFDPPRVLLNSQFAAYALWFVFGMAAGLQPTRFKALLVRVRPVLPVLACLAVALALVEWEMLRRPTGRPWISGGVTLGDNLVSLTLLCAFLAYDGIALPWMGTISWLGTMSFGVYLSHVAFLDVAARAVYHAWPPLLAHHLVFHLVLTAVGVGASVGLMSAARRVAALRRVYPLLFG